jgi:hypothetical protein
VVSSRKTRGAVAAPVILWLNPENRYAFASHERRDCAFHYPPKLFNLLGNAIPAQFFVDKVQAAQIHKNPYFRMA